MFSWFTFSKEDDQTQKKSRKKEKTIDNSENSKNVEKIEEHEDIYFIPDAPPMDRNLALKIKNNKSKYKHLYFCNSENLFRDLIVEYNSRLSYREDRENFRGLLPFLFIDLHFYFHKKQMKNVLRELVEKVQYREDRIAYQEKIRYINYSGELVQECVKRLLNYRYREIVKITRLPLTVEIMLEYENRILNRLYQKRKFENAAYSNLCVGAFTRGFEALQQEIYAQMAQETTDQYILNYLTEMRKDEDSAYSNFCEGSFSRGFEALQNKNENLQVDEQVDEKERDFIDVYVEKFSVMESPAKKGKFEELDWDVKLKEWGIEQNPSFINPFYLDDVNSLRYEKEVTLQESLSESISEETEEDTDNDNDKENCEGDKEQKLLDEESGDEELDEIVIHNPGSYELLINRELTEEDMAQISLDIGREINEYNKNDIELNCDKEINFEDKDMLSRHEKKTITPKEGRLELYIGPMYSGKSSKIVFKLTAMADQRFKCLYINSKKDVRETESADMFVSTHNSSYSKLSEKIDCIKAEKLSNIDISEYDFIAVDEFQFFNDVSVVDTIMDWVTFYGKCVFIASLDGDAYRRKFGYVLDLIPRADHVEKLTAYCDNCRDNYKRLIPAPFTARMTSDKTAELVGGKEIYRAMCRSCHDFHLDIMVNNI